MIRHPLSMGTLALVVTLAPAGCNTKPDQTGADSVVSQLPDAPLPDAPLLVPPPGGNSLGASSPKESAASPSPDPSSLHDHDQEISTTDLRGDSPERGLKPDLSPEELLKFMVQADKDMYTIKSGGSGIRDPQQSRQTLFQIIHLKQEAARRLAENENIAPKLRTEGMRGQLQALSHLASLGQLDAADKLRQVAEQNLQSEDPRLISDSRLVLLGFRLEELQNGVEGSEQTVLDLATDLAETLSDKDVPALMVLGRAREILNHYGYIEKSKEVRDLINQRFASSSDPHIAKLAAQVAGNVIYDGVNEHLNLLIKQKTVPEAQWSESIERLIDESPDMQTVQYLAGAALDLESRDLTDPAATIYRILQSRFDVPETATAREVVIAVKAREKRRQAIGRSFPFQLPALDGSPLSMEDYRGKVVLMPFWAAQFPQSLQIVPLLKEIVEEHPDDVVLIGMNLDLTPTEATVYAEQADLGFDSFRAGSSATPSKGNTVAIQFGLVSMPFVVIFDPRGNVAEIDFAGRKLKSTVLRLIEAKAFE